MTARLLTLAADRSPEWLDARRGRVGGSDVGVVAGLSPHKTSDELAAEKTTPVEGDGSVCTEAQERGIFLEPAIITWLCAKERFELDAERSRGMWVDGDDDRLAYSPDAVTIDGVLLEAKTTQWRDSAHGWGRAGTDLIPVWYQAQVQWGMGILGCNRAVVGVLSGQPKFGFARYKINFDRWVFNRLRATAVTFLDHLQDQQQGLPR